MTRIKVVHLVEDLKIGGLERVIATLAYRLNKDRFDVRIWCLVRGGDIFQELKVKGIDAEILGMHSHRSLLFFLRLCRKIRRNNIHILHTHGYTATTLGRLAGIFSRIPVILSHMHSTYWSYSPKKLFIDRFLSRFTDRIICCSQAVADFVAVGERINPDKITVIYNGVDIENSKVDNLAEISERKEFSVGCVASLFPHKGHRYLLEAARYVIDNFPSKTQFVLVGQGMLRQQLMEYAQRLGISAHVLFKGPVLDISNLLSSFDLVVLPSSEREGLGLSLIEAMAVGKPVIGTSIGGIPEVIMDGENGLLVPPGDSRALAKSIVSILKDYAKAKGMGRKGREIVKNKFSSFLMLQRIEKLYTDLFDEKCREE